MEKYVLTFDQGTTSSRCILFDRKGRIVASAQREFPQIFPKPGWVEHDPMDIWSSQIGVAMEAIAKIGADADEISAVGITNQRETTVVWDRETGQPIYNAIVWQCRRTADIIDSLDKEFRQYIRKQTGLIPDAYFSASKIKWILDNVKGAREKAEDNRLLFGTIDTWLMWNLSGRKIHATDYTNASRTMLFDIKKLKWDKKILEYFDIPECMMPEVHPSGYKFGYTDSKLFGKEIPICAAAGDQQAALFGQGCFEEGEAKNTYGTGCFLLMNTGKNLVRSKNGLVTTIACGFDKNVNYALEGSIFIGGAVVQWLRDEMEFIKKSSACEKPAECVDDTEGAYLVPAFVGLGAPYWKQDARGTLVGITRGFGKNHMIRAAVESIAYQVYDVLEAMEADSETKITCLKADGGACANNFLMNFQAGILNTEIFRPKMLEITALGAAYLAGITSGFWKDKEEVKENMTAGKTFVPEMDEEKRKELIKGWRRAVRCAISWAEDDK